MKSGTELMQSRLLEGADYAAAYFDREYGKTRRDPGAWRTNVKKGVLTDWDTHESQRRACEFIGLAGVGSPDPAFRPSNGGTGRHVAIEKGRRVAYRDGVPLTLRDGDGWRFVYEDDDQEAVAA
jgi:hypothetical protein